MPHVAARAQVTVDNPHAEGLIEKLPFQRDYRYMPTKRDDETYGGVLGQFTSHDGTEWLDAMHCLKPRGRVPALDMTGEWTVESGVWRSTTPTVLSPRSVWADFYNSDAQQYGQMLSVEDFGRGTVLGIIRDAPPDDLADYPRFVSIAFLGNTNAPTFRSVTFIFPYAWKTQPHPYVRDKLTSEEGTGNIVAVWENSGGEGVKVDDDTRLEWIYFEIIDGCMVVRHSGREKAFVYQPYDRSDSRFTVGAFSYGKVRLTVWGHSAMLYCMPLVYPVASNALAQPYQDMSVIYSDMESDHANVHQHGWTPPEDTDWTTTAELMQSPGLGWAPKTSFAWAGVGVPNTFPVSYVTTLDLSATHLAGTSSPDTLEGQKIVLGVDYTIKLAGRGQTCTVKVDDPDGTKADAWGGQNLIVVKCGWDDVTPVQKFKGHLGEKAEITRDGGDGSLGRPAYQLDIQDAVDARLAAKFMVDRSAAGYSQLASWVYSTLYDSGVPEEQLTDIEALTTGSMADIYIPGSYGAKDLAHDWEPTVAVPDALDKVTSALGYSWGWNCETGQWFLRPPLVYGGTPDWTLDDDTTTEDAFAWDITHIRSRHEFRNYLYMIAVTSGGVASVYLWADQNSHQLSTASNFIGCDLWEVIKETDLWTGLAKGQKRWDELQRLPSVIKWGMRAKPETLGPAKYVKMQVTKMGIATDSIYRITEEHGVQPGSPSLNYSQTLTAEWVQDAPA